LPSPVAEADADDAAAKAPRFGARVEGLAAIGLLPSPATGVRASLVALPFDALRFELSGAVYVPNAIPGNEASFSLVQGELAACPLLAEFGATLALWSCARLTAGAVLARAEGAVSRDSERFVLNAGAGAELAWALGARTSLHLGLAALVPTVRDRYFLSGPEGRRMAFRMSPVIGLANLALQLRLF
jgi:hypothetical protein